MSKRSTVSLSIETVERIKEVQKFLEKENGFSPSVTQVIDYLIKVEEKVRSISQKEEK